MTVDPTSIRPDLLPDSIPTAILALMTLGAILVWVVFHRAVSGRAGSPLPAAARKGLRALPYLLPITSAVAASWLLFQTMARVFWLAGAWSLWTAALVCGIAMEGTVLLYAHESRIVPRRYARGLVFCRLAAIAVTVFILLQPVYVTERSRTIRRRVAVLLDESASMWHPDTAWRLSEALDAAQALGGLDASLRTNRPSSREADTALWDKLSAEERNAIRELTEVPRAEIARKLLESSKVLKFESSKDSSKVLKCESSKVPSDDGAEAPHAQHNFRTSELQNFRTSPPQPLLPKLRARYDVNLFRFGNGIQPIESSKVLKFESSKVPSPIAAQSAAEEQSNFRTLELPNFRTSPVPSEAAPDGADAHNFRTSELQNFRTSPDPREEAFRSATDFTRALEHVMDTVPSEELAGVLLMTDGRHTGESGVAAITRRLGQAGVPVSSVVIGGTQPLFDVAVAEARVPETVFLGDRVRMTVTVQATAAKGRETKLRLTCNGERVAEETVSIDADDWTREFRLTDDPKEQGLRHYRVEIEPLDGEATAENNAWNTDVFVTDDRTNVLLVDNRPRWEYRYLRNLFYGRDKSVHLQFMLVDPDQIADVIPPSLPDASATRAFGDAEAGRLPASREEWRMFDVIILGDVGEDLLTPEVIGNIRYCVEERGALLVVIAGPEQMPYGIQSAAFRELLPVAYTPNASNWRKAGESAFQIRLTPAGRPHDAMRMSASASENEQIWAEMPELRWRLPLDDVKPGADVLAYAVPLGGGEDHVQAAYRAVAEAMDDPEEATRRLADVRRAQAQNALVVAKNQGQGKVMMLMTDRTWRFRYRVGDTLHHRFWGQVMRWGTGEKLRSGNALVRLGTDLLNYMPTEPVQVMARLSAPDFAPLLNAHAEAVLSRDGKELGRVQLRYRKDSNGIYEGTLDPLAETGAYTLTLHSPEARKQLGADYPENLETQFSVVTTRRPAEFISLTADHRVPMQMAQISGGLAVSPADTAALWESFGEGNRTVSERLERNLWASWWLFLIIVACLTTEWLIRKKGGLA